MSPHVSSLSPCLKEVPAPSWCPRQRGILLRPGAASGERSDPRGEPRARQQQFRVRRLFRSLIGSSHQDVRPRLREFAHCGIMPRALAAGHHRLPREGIACAWSTILRGLAYLPA